MSTANNEKALGSGASGDLAVVGEGTPNETKVSIQLLQGIYHELTGKTEDVSKSYNEPFQTILSDFEQLNFRIAQCCEQYNVKALNCSVKVYYVNDTQETYSSFERFASFNAGTTSAVESVLLTYNFLIVLPKVEKPQGYTISVRLASRIAVESQMRENMPFHMPKILRTMGNRTAVVNVKYIDYSVARSLLNTADQWFEGLAKGDTSKLWKYIVRRSHYIPVMARYVTGAFVTYIVYQTANYFVPSGATLHQLATFTLFSFIGLFSAYRLAHHLGSAAEDSLDRWSQLSYLSLTNGDKNLIKKAASANQKNGFAALTKFLLALFVSVVAKVVASALTA
ncbi:hypothetical protein FHY11_004012 [Xanthomonas arboricola]|uniref:hypothetical protein n=1 Tax=Xanthomonas euroxanthea TaxID=2259622 RepID=UPI00141A9D23|nr:hypothetical protein [Xanthomonas euroxanthea]NIK10459.1 hypothetical protein [Xanthomonas euroxanthea]